MSIESQIQLGFAAAAAADRALRLIITGTNTGDLSTLTTTHKTSIIAAINDLSGTLTALINDTNNAALTTTYSAAHIESRLAAVRDGIIGGASAAYDTLIELQNAITGDESQISALLTAVGNKVAYDVAQTLTSTQQTQARANIGAAAASDLVTTNTNVTNLTGRVSTAETTITAQGVLLSNAAGADYAGSFNTALNA